MKRAWRVGVLLMCIVWADAAYGQAQPVLEAVSPQGAQRGQTVTLTLRGRNIGRADALLFNIEGVASEIKALMSEADAVIAGDGIEARVDSPQTITATIAVSPNAPIGVHTARLRTPDGVSTGRTFIIGNMPELAEAEPNSSLETPQQVTLPVTISGVVSSANDRDAFRFNANKGTRLIADVLAQRMGSPLDSYIALFDADGKELARNDISNGLDSQIDVAAPKTGAYTLMVRDSQHRGGGNYAYRLSVGALPRLDGIFPLGGKRGAESVIALTGRNLGGVNSMRVVIAPDAPLGLRETRLFTPTGYVTNARLFQVEDLPEATEKEPNNALDKANAVPLPSVVNGRIDKPGDRDRFKFQAKAGQQIIFETYASRLGSELDALLTLYGPPPPAPAAAEGETPPPAPPPPQLAVNDDGVGPEARFAFNFPADGEYSIEIRDLSANGGPGFAYRLRAAPRRPDFNVNAAPTNPVKIGNATDNGIARVGQGGTTAFNVNIGRIDGFNGPLRIESRGLPPNYAVSSAELAAGKSNALVTVTAPEDAQLETLTLRFAAVGSIGGRRVERLSSPILLTALPRPPFRLEMAEPSLSALQDQNAAANIIAVRSDGFTAPIALSIVGLPALSTQVAPAIGQGADRSTVTIRAWNINGRTDDRTVPAAGEQYVTVRGTAAVNGIAYTQTTPAVRLQVLEAPFVVRVQPVRQSFVVSEAQPEEEETADVPTADGEEEAAETPETEANGAEEAAEANGAEEAAEEPETPETVDAELTLTLVRRGGFTGAVDISAVNLPEGLTADPVRAADGASEVKVKVKAARTMKAGDYRFHFIGKATINGRPFQQITSTVTAKIIR